MNKIANIYKADTPNVNGVIYPREELERAIEEFNESARVVILSDYPVVHEDLRMVIGTAKLAMNGDYVEATISALSEQTQGTRLAESVNLNESFVVMPTARASIMNNKVSGMCNIKLWVTQKDGLDIIGANEQLFNIKDMS